MTKAQYMMVISPLEDTSVKTTNMTKAQYMMVKSPLEDTSVKSTNIDQSSVHDGQITP
jgi:predicted metal-binding transcription factor (methanogenesis marker protein 9)